MRLHRRTLLAGLWSTLAAKGSSYGASVKAGDPSPSRVSLVDVGGRPGSDIDAEPIFKAALARLPRSGKAILEIPGGTWHFRRTQGVVLPINDYQNLTIEGNGAHLVFAGRAQPLLVSNSLQPSIQGITIDWEAPPFSQGEVVDTQDGRMAIDIAIDSGFDVQSDAVPQAIATYSRQTGLMTPGVDAYNVVSRVEHPRPKTIRLRLRKPLPLAPGQTVVLRYSIYEAPLIKFLHCEGASIQNVTIHSGPGMGVVSEYCRGVTVQGLHIVPPPGSQNLMTTTADGTHFNSCSGEIILQDCTMTGMGDDCVNIHGRYFRILSRLSNRSVLVATGATSFGASGVSPQGDQVHIVLRSYETEATAKITDHEQRGDQAILHFDRDMPSSINPGDLIFDTARTSRATVKGCHFPGNRARGVLAHSNVSIEGCSFSGQSEQAILVDVKPSVLEGPVGAQIAIRGNKIADVHRRSPGAAIWVGAHVAGLGRARHLDSAMVNHDIAVEGNDFSNLAGPAFFGGSTTRLNIVDNKLTNIRSPSIVLEHVSDVQIRGNVSSPPSSIAVKDTEKVDVSGNKGLYVA